MQFKEALKLVLEEEGGFVNHPKDPGGATNLGVTKKVYDAWLGKESTMEAFKALAPEDVAPLYEEQYWKKAKCDLLPSGFNYAVFDMAVHSGPVRAVKALQEAIGFTGNAVDGVLGPVTLTALQKSNKLITLLDFIWERYDFLHGLSTWVTFGRGWRARLVRVRNSAILDLYKP